MNKERIKQLRDHLAGLSPERIDMRAFVDYIDEKYNYDLDPAVLLTDCNTAGCIAGWAHALFAPLDLDFDPDDVAARELDLSDEERQNLFMPSGYNRWNPTKGEIIQVLDILLTTGVVNWDAVIGARE